MSPGLHKIQRHDVSEEEVSEKARSKFNSFCSRKDRNSPPYNHRSSENENRDNTAAAIALLNLNQQKETSKDLDTHEKMIQEVITTDEKKECQLAPEENEKAKSPEIFEQSRDESDGIEEKPNHSYISLIACAVLSSPEKRLVLSDIYNFIQENFTYFRNKGPGWRNSIRHNLSLNECFIKAGRSPNGKGHYWAINPNNYDDFLKGDFRRRRTQRRNKRINGISDLEEPSHPNWYQPYRVKERQYRSPSAFSSHHTPCDYEKLSSPYLSPHPSFPCNSKKTIHNTLYYGRQPPTKKNRPFDIENLLKDDKQIPWKKGAVTNQQISYKQHGCSQTATGKRNCHSKSKGCSLCTESPPVNPLVTRMCPEGSVVNPLATRFESNDYWSSVYRSQLYNKLMSNKFYSEYYKSNNALLGYR